MIYCEDETSINNLNMVIMRNMYDEFIEVYHTFHSNNMKRLEEIKNDILLLNAFYSEYPYLKPKKTKKTKTTRKKRGLKYSTIYKLFEYPAFEKFKREDFNEYLFKILIKKIRGIFKHGQCAKTYIACEKILQDLKKGFLTIAITKNTLFANIQWTTRFIKQMTNAGLTNLKNEVLIISSDYNDLDGNATHCKNLNEAWSKICDNNNNYKVIFICANKTRIIDVCNLLSKYHQSSFNRALLKKIVVQYDEAHNNMYGVPTCREFIENMLLYDFVKEFIPITASKNPLNDETGENPLWIKENIYSNKLNYINKDLEKTRMKSDNPGYSSIKDADSIIIDELYEYKRYENIISPSLFREHYPKGNYENTGNVNSCPIIFCGDEELALNTSKQILDNEHIPFEITTSDGDTVETYEILFKENEFNLHLMITPKRTIITEMLMIYARDKSYKPIVIGLFGGKIHCKYINSENQKTKTTIELNAGQEFNEALYIWLQKRKFLDKCVIIMGNYLTIGESNTFVNYNYGYLRSVILPKGCNLSPEQHYQFLLRCCFLLEQFTGLTKTTFTKFIIGYKEGIDDAIEYEKLNDDIVQDLIDNPDEPEETNILLENNHIQVNASTSSSASVRHSIPVQFKIEDEECEYVQKMRNIMKLTIRNETNKSEFMKNLLEALKEKSIEKTDKNSPEIKLDNYKLTEFRCYREGVDPDNYRFASYYEKFYTNGSLNNGELNPDECSIYCCLKKHKSATRNGEHINNPNTFYMSFVN